MRYLVLVLLMVALCLASCKVEPAAALQAPVKGVKTMSASRFNKEGIQPWPGNPRYWQYKGKPVFLLGGSQEDNLFQIPDLEEQLDLLVKCGGNYVRNTLSSRDEGNVWPFFRRPDGKYDLEKPNEEYYARLKRFLELTYQRDIIVQFEMWDRFDYARKEWLENPFRPANNINYTSEESHLANEYPNHPGTNENRFFFTVPELDNNQLVLKYQQAHVKRVLDLSLQYPNVLYCMDNETSADPHWGAYWATFIKDYAKARGKRVYVAEMWDSWNLKSDMHKQSLDHPEIYDFEDASQNNQQKGQVHWDNFQWMWNYIADHPRPINTVKTYGADGGPFGNTRDGQERFWRHLIGGVASARFHRPHAVPPVALGLSELAQANIKSARMLADAFDFFHAVPDSNLEKLLDRSDNEAFLSYVPGKQYAVYFTNGGEVKLDLRGVSGTFKVRWLDILQSKWQEAPDVQGDQLVDLKAPSKSYWVALLECK